MLVLKISGVQKKIDSDLVCMTKPNLSKICILNQCLLFPICKRVHAPGSDLIVDLKIKLPKNKHKYFP